MPPGHRLASTTLSTGCEPDLFLVEKAGPRPTQRRPGPVFLQVRRPLTRVCRASHGLLVRSDSRVAGNLGPQERNKPWTAPATRHPQAVGDRAGVGLTLSNASAYRCSVTRCRPVPHVHEEQPTPGSCRGWAVPAEWLSKHCRSRPGVAALTTPWREAREQAYVPAEQPPPSQGAWFPPAHAHPRRPRHLVGPSPQGPQQPGRLTASACGDHERVARGATTRRR